MLPAIGSSSLISRGPASHARATDAPRAVALRHLWPMTPKSRTQDTPCCTIVLYKMHAASPCPPRCRRTLLRAFPIGPPVPSLGVSVHSGFGPRAEYSGASGHVRATSPPTCTVLARLAAPARPKAVDARGVDACSARFSAREVSACSALRRRRRNVLCARESVICPVPRHPTAAVSKVYSGRWRRPCGCDGEGGRPPRLMSARTNERRQRAHVLAWGCRAQPLGGPVAAAGCCFPTDDGRWETAVVGSSHVGRRGTVGGSTTHTVADPCVRL